MNEWITVTFIPNENPYLGAQLFFLNICMGSNFESSLLLTHDIKEHFSISMFLFNLMSAYCSLNLHLLLMAVQSAI